MEPISVIDHSKILKATSAEDLRLTMAERFANCLMGEFERGARVAHYKAPRIVAGVSVVINGKLGDLSKRIEYALNAIATEHRQEKLRADYEVTLNAVNNQLSLTAYVRHA